MNDAILVGRRTAVLDNPSLTTRLWPGSNPLRLVIDRRGVLDKGLHLFDKTIKTVVFTEVFRDFGNTEQIEQVTLDFNKDILPQIMQWLYEHKVQRILVEGGGTLLQKLIDADLWDEAYVETAPIQLGQGVKAPDIHKRHKMETTVCFGHQINHFSQIK